MNNGQHTFLILLLCREAAWLEHNGSDDCAARSQNTVTKIYVGNLPVTTNEGQLQVMFAVHGAVEDVTIITDRSTGQSKGFAFVKMTSNEAARIAISSLDGSMVGDKRLKVDEARPVRNPE